jgi:hypothetical protein
MNDLKETIQFELESRDLLNEFMQLGAGAGPRRCYPVHRTVVGEVENSGTMDRVRIVILDMKQRQF